jgi:hypothetical protein
VAPSSQRIWVPGKIAHMSPTLNSSIRSGHIIHFPQTRMTIQGRTVLFKTLWFQLLAQFCELLIHHAVGVKIVCCCCRCFRRSCFRCWDCISVFSCRKLPTGEPVLRLFAGFYTLLMTSNSLSRTGTLLFPTFFFAELDRPFLKFAFKYRFQSVWSSLSSSSSLSS